MGKGWRAGWEVRRKLTQVPPSGYRIAVQTKREMTRRGWSGYTYLSLCFSKFFPRGEACLSRADSVPRELLFVYLCNWLRHVDGVELHLKLLAAVLG